MAVLASLLARRRSGYSAGWSGTRQDCCFRRTVIGKLGDVINHLFNSNPAKVSDVVNLLGRVGGVAKQFGLTELQMASFSNALSLWVGRRK